MPPLSALKTDEIYHFGTKEHSGRYPWGSGERPRQRLEKRRNKAINQLNKNLQKIEYNEAVKKRYKKYKKEKPILYTLSGLRIQDYLDIKIGDKTEQKNKKNIEKIIEEISSNNFGEITKEPDSIMLYNMMFGNFDVYESNRFVYK